MIAKRENTHLYLVGKTDYITPGRHNCPVEITWSLEDGCFSMSGAIWMASRRDIYSGGQNLEEIAARFPDNAKVQRMVAVWRIWHLNDMQAGCEHQRANWDREKEVEVVHYGLTSEARKTRDHAREKQRLAGARGTKVDLTKTEEALANLENPYGDIYTPPDADSPLSGCYEVKKRETKRANWVFHTEHPDGILTKPCEVCGYKYGTKWLKAELPPEVVAEIQSWSVPDEQSAKDGQ